MSIEQLQYDWEHKQEIKLRGELYVEIINSKQKEEPSKRLVELFCDLVNNTLTRFKYNQDLYDDLFQSAILDLLLYWKKYNEKSNCDPKMYMNQIIKSSFSHTYYTKLKHQSQTICLQDIQQVF